MKWFNNTSLATKLILTTVSGGFSLLILGLINFSTLQNVLKYYNHVVQFNLPNAEYLGDLREHSGVLGVHLNELAIQFYKGDYSGSQFSEIDHAIEEYKKADQRYKEMEFAEGEGTLYKVANDYWLKNQDEIKELRKIYYTKDPSQKEFLEKSVAQVSAGLQEQLKHLEKLSNFQHDQAVKWSQEAQTSAKSGQVIALTAIVVFFLFAILVGIVLSRSLSHKLRALALELNGGAEEVANASHGILATAQELSQATTEQAASLEQTAASIEEMASMVAKNSENASSTASLAAQSHASATRGEEVVKSMITAMEEINHSNREIMNAINQSNRDISDIIRVITEIGNKTKVINDIVFQTKLLSFNASVEAARAGEHGRGFAVVAEEVGNLAQMSGNAAKEISTMLDGSIQKVESIVRETQSRVEHLIEQGHSKVEQGTGVAHQCGEVLREIVENVAKVTNMAEEISAASDEQSKGVSEISKAMNQLDHVTQQNAQTSDATASSSAQLSNQATGLKNTVGRLMTEVEGSGIQAKSIYVETANKSRPTKSTPSNVIPMKSHTAKLKVPTSAKVNRPPGSSVSSPLKAAAGSGAVAQTPSADDSRFEDV
jgi:methyl-accepting chemotaxis protein